MNDATRATMAVTAYRMETLSDFVGREIGVSSWVTVDQRRIDEFADCTGDRQWIHVMEFAEKGLISKYGIPDRIYFVDAIPKTSVGKLDKKVIRAQLHEWVWCRTRANRADSQIP